MLPTLVDSLEQLRKYIETSGDKKIASTDIGNFYKAAGPADFKTVFQKAGGLKKALEHTDKLVYVTSEKNPLLGTIEVRRPTTAVTADSGAPPCLSTSSLRRSQSFGVRSPPTATVTAKGKATANLDGSEGGPQAGTPSSLQSPTNPLPTLQFNSDRLPLRPGAKICMHWLKNRRCDFGGKCKFDHPDVVNELPTDGVVLSTSKDKKNCTIGFIALDEGNYESDEQSRAKVYFFHGEPPKHGFKVLGTGVLQSAGLELIKGDKVAELVLKGAKTSQGYQVVAGSLVKCAPRKEETFKEYLVGLLEVLRDAKLRGTALSCLGHARACAAVWTGLAAHEAHEALAPFVVQVIEMLVQDSLSSGSGRRAATCALQNVLLSGVTLPPASPLLGVIQCHEKQALRTQLVKALCSAWPLIPQARRRSFMLLQALVRKHPAEAAELLSLEQMIELLGATLPGGDQISCYRWRELPLKLLQSETTSQPGIDVGAGAVLNRVLRNGGDYETFEAYMETYVGLLREDCFAAMRRGLQAHRCGKLDERDMRVFSGVRVVGMSPPNIFGGAEGTIVELHTHCDVNPKNIMFGSLLALAPRGSFDTSELVWATVAGADELPKRRGEVRIFAELASQLNEESEAQLVSELLRFSGQITMAESPTFYRAYAPAIAVLQRMQPADIPFSDQIIRGEQECEDATATLLDSTIDASVVLTSAEIELESVPMSDFNRVLKRFTDQDSKQLGTFTSALDRSQAAAIHSAMTHRLTVIQGPPGTGKSYTIVRLLRLLDSIKGESHGESGPVLVLTYKNRSLEVRARHIQTHNPHTALVKISYPTHFCWRLCMSQDILGGCMKTWPDEVARCGGAARPGSLLEHRHIKTLLRNDRRKSTDYDAAKSNADAHKKKVQEAAVNLSRARSFSAETICAEEFRDQLRSLLLDSPSVGSSSEAEREELTKLLDSGDQSTLEAKASDYLNLWLPSAKDCAVVCQAPPSDGTFQPANRGARDGHDRQEQDDRARDR